MLEATKERLKVLPKVTVAALEEAVEHGFRELGHRNLSVFLPLLENMSWKTSAAKHVQAFVALEEVLAALLRLCSNGLLPDADLVKAFQAAGRENKFIFSSEHHEAAVLNHFCLRVRQMAGKLRDLVASASAWQSFDRKLTIQQRKVFLKLCRLLQPNFMAGAEACPTQDAETRLSRQPSFAASETPSSITDSLPLVSAPLSAPNPVVSPAPVSLASWLLSLSLISCFLVSIFLFVLFSLLFRFATQAQFARSFLANPDGFMAAAERRAADSANRSFPSVGHGEPVDDGRKSRSSKPSVKKEKPKDVRKSNKSSEKCAQGPWWKVLKMESKAAALRSLYNSEKARGLKMSAKNFASRLYHKVDFDLSLARQAHQDALRFCEMLDT